MIKPWAKKKSILKTAFEAYSFGSERGQIKRLSDHNHIIPLYDFAVEKLKISIVLLY